jgi:hypothetical protein
MPVRASVVRPATAPGNGDGRFGSCARASGTVRIDDRMGLIDGSLGVTADRAAVSVGASAAETDLRGPPADPAEPPADDADFAFPLTDRGASDADRAGCAASFTEPSAFPAGRAALPTGSGSGTAVPTPTTPGRPGSGKGEAEAPCAGRSNTLNTRYTTADAPANTSRRITKRTIRTVAAPSTSGTGRASDPVTTVPSKNR